MLRIIELEGQPQHSGHRPQGDVTLFPVEPDADNLLTLKLSPAHHPAVRHGTGVTASLRSGKGETGHLFAPRQPRQIILLLLIGAVIQQQLRRPQGIGHHHGYRRRGTASGNFHHHTGMRQSGKLQAAIFPGDDHAEKTFILNKLPDLGRQIMQFLGNLPIIEHAAQGLHRPVEKGLFIRAQDGHRHLQKAPPIGSTTKEITIPPDRARFQRLFFSLRHTRHDAAKTPQHPFANQLTPQQGDIQGHG